MTSAVLSTILAMLALASLGIALSGSFSGDTTTPDGILYIFYAVYWVWGALMSWSVWRVAGKHSLDITTSRSAYGHYMGSKFTPRPEYLPRSGGE